MGLSDDLNRSFIDRRLYNKGLGGSHSVVLYFFREGTTGREERERESVLGFLTKTQWTSSVGL